MSYLLIFRQSQTDIDIYLFEITITKNSYDIILVITISFFRFPITSGASQMCAAFSLLSEFLNVKSIKFI